MTVGDPTSRRPIAPEFAVWVQPHLPAMAGLAARLVAPVDRDDVVQESLLRAWRRRSTYDPSKGSELGWLLAIVGDQARRRRSRSRPPSLPLDRAAGAVLDRAGDIDLERAIAQLSTRQRLAVDLYYFVGLDTASCAEVMGCAEGTVKATLHHARVRLRALLDERSER
jgi:RNA polymerase sigma-70 factor (ECF subfamily)